MRLDKKGFTAMELLIVIAIMLILMGLALVSLNLARERSRDNVRVAAVNEVILALEQFRSVCRNYPAQITDLDEPQYCDNSSENELALSHFISSLPRLPGEDVLLYRSYASSPVENDRCTAFHIGIGLENSKHPALIEDDDKVASDFNELFDCKDSNDDSIDGVDTEDSAVYDIAS